MAYEYQWRDEFKIGVERIDREHRQLFSIINRLYTIEIEKKDVRWTCQEGIKFFKNHAVSHFNYEEEYMASINYEGLEQHRELHKTFRKKTLPSLEKALERENYSKESVDHFLGVCVGWLIGHTLTEDMAITGKKENKRWKNMFCTNDQDEVKRVILQLLFEMFHVEAKVISDTYGGEKFGGGVYYRLVWGSPETDEKLEIFLVYERRFLTKTIGTVIGIKTDKLDVMLLNATRYATRQLVCRAMECFPELSDYVLEEEDFLYYRQFRQLMERGQHQLSLLMESDLGYIAYCVMAPHLVDEGIGLAIIDEVDAAGMDRYLQGEKEAQKLEKRRKILVVDDSVTLCTMMSDLFESDYDVVSVNSGVAAIRSITLNPPDIVLLDYEMPICDGPQILEMLRSEKGFSDIPVFFLTGRKDSDSIIRVMPLKPVGYLLKTSKSEDIKKAVDDYFAKQDQEKANAKKNAKGKAKKK